MYYVNKYFMCGMVLWTMIIINSPSNIHAQSFEQDFSFDEESLLVDEEDTKSDFDLRDYFIGEVGYNNAQNISAERIGAIINLGVDVPLQKGRLYLNYGATQSTLTLKQRLDEIVVQDSNLSLPTTRTIEIENRQFLLKEGFVQHSISSFGTISVGRLRNAWGQFELYSPSAAMLPVNTTITTLIPSKLDFIYAQDQLKLSLFPNPKMEVQLYAMNDLRTDPVVDTSFSRWLGPVDINDDDFVNGDFNASNVEDILLNNQGSELNQDTTQSALRLLFYPDWGTLGITYHQGINGSEPILRAPVGRVQGNINPINQQRPEIISSEFKDARQSFFYYPEGTLFGLEVSVPVGAWTWRYEYAKIDSIQGLGFNGTINLSKNGEFTQGEAFENAINARSGLLQGTSLYHATSDIQALGFLYEQGAWYGSVMLLSRTLPKPKNASDKEIVRLYESLEAETGITTDPITTLPLVSLFRSSGDEKQHRYGLNLGAVGGSGGIALIYRYNITESLNVALSIGQVDLSNGQSNDRYYKLEGDGNGSTTTQFSLGWRF
ncbi:MAG: hypothetical protein K0U45_10300 [Alphaproteobacteria bacterium]|nr:hypothetical protein [Alphaproteobacteria bacterium]